MNAELNSELSDIFIKMSEIYRYMGGEERFRAIAYNKAAKVIAALPQDVSVYLKNDTLKALPGIGEGISEKIEEYILTGKIEKYEQLKATTPTELIDMMEISGFGPQTLKSIHDELKISTKDELTKALQNGSISKLKGFGFKKVEGLKRGLKLHKTIEDRMLLWIGLEVGEKLKQWFAEFKEVKQVELAGSLRRKKETIGDFDILISCEERHRKKITNAFTVSKFVKQVIAKGLTKVSIILMDSGKQVDLRIVNEDEWGAALQYFTGSKEHNIHLRTIAKEKGYKISEYGIFNITTDKRIAGKSEDDIYRTLNFQPMPPEMREDKGEIELAAKKQIPELITLQDIKGDLHIHSNWSDGINTIEDIVKYIKQHFAYQYIVITDHSKSSRIANGMDERQILKQLKEIEQINEKLGEPFVKKGIEVDILPDGALDISDEILSQLDWVMAAIHSNFNKDNTSRIIKACENTYVNCIAHATGRLIGQRESYQVDMGEVISVAKNMHTAIEINAQPQRMDVNDELAMLAREKGVSLLINTDSHSLSNFDFMKLGVYTARRAWCTKHDVLNTKSWNELELFRKSKIKKRN